MNTSVAIDNQHREEAIEQAHSPISETKAIRSTSTKEKPNYELLAAQLDEIKADIKRKVGAEDGQHGVTDLVLFRKAPCAGRCSCENAQ